MRSKSISIRKIGGLKANHQDVNDDHDDSRRSERSDFIENIKNHDDTVVVDDTGIHNYFVVFESVNNFNNGTDNMTFQRILSIMNCVWMRTMVTQDLCREENLTSLLIVLKTDKNEDDLLLCDKRQSDRVVVLKALNAY